MTFRTKSQNIDFWESMQAVELVRIIEKYVYGHFIPCLVVKNLPQNLCKGNIIGRKKAQDTNKWTKIGRQILFYMGFDSNKDDDGDKHT